MMISVILAIINFVFLLVKDNALFSFKHFWWIFPAEIAFWTMLIWMFWKFGYKWMDVWR